MKRRVALSCSILAGLLLAGLLAATVVASPPPPAATTTGTTTTTTTPTPATIPPGVTIAGVEVGGMLAADAATAVQSAFEAPLELILPGTRVLVPPDLLGATPGVQRAVAKAQTSIPNTAVPLGVAVDQARTAAFVAGLARRYDRLPADAELALRRLRPWLSKERIGLRLEQRRAVRDVVVALSAAARRPVRLYEQKLRAEVTRRNFGPVIVIHRSTNRLTLYRGMRYQRAFTVATGQRAYPTPLGRFGIVVKWRNPWWYPPASPWAKGQKPVPPGPENPLGTRWMGLSAPGVGIHGTPEGGSIGYSVSHGCIRMRIPEAEWLFNHVEVGTTVFIVAG